MDNLFQIGTRGSVDLAAQTRASDGRIITFVASSDSLDRHGTKILPMGINTDRYLKNPVAGFGHDLYGGWFSAPDPRSVIGRTVAIRKDDKRMEADIEFLGADVNPNAEMIFGMVKAGALSAVSIGFIPRKVMTEVDTNGNSIPVITECELLEISVVPIPSNPDALALSRELPDVVRQKIDEVVQSAVSAAIQRAGTLEVATPEFREKVLSMLTDAIRSGEGGITEKLIEALKRKPEPSDAEILAADGVRQACAEWNLRNVLRNAG